MSLPPIGSTPFFRRLLSRLGEPFLDPVIAQSILLCLVSGSNHLILRSSEQDLALVVKIAAFTLSSIFHYPTRKLRIKHSSTASADPVNHFLRSLFIPSHPTNKPQTTYSASRFATGKHQHTARSRSCPSTLIPEDGDPLRFNVDLDTGSIDSTPNSGHASSHSKSKAKSDGLLTDPVADTEGERTLKLPRALVVSGLEHAGMPAQRALVDVLRDRRVVLDGTSNLSGRSKPDDDLDGVWNLPDGFILVYVCPWDPRERPAIHKTLIDKFSMSATVTLQPSTRHALHSSFSFSNSSGSNYRPSTSSSSPLSSPSTLPFSAPALLDTLRTHYKHVHFPPALSLYTADLFSAARNHPQLDGVLLGYRAKTDANSLIAAGRVLGLGAEVTVPLVDEAEEGQQSDAGSSGFGPQENDSEVHVLDVSAADVARIVPRVISHRVRVRDGPEDEVLGSAVFSAVEELEPGGRQEIWERSTVKDILVQILADV